MKKFQRKDWGWVQPDHRTGVENVLMPCVIQYDVSELEIDLLILLGVCTKQLG